MSTTMTNTTQHETQDRNDRLGQSDHGSEYPATFTPRFDIWEGDDQMTLYGDLPGVDPKGLDIRFENRQLTIHGKVRRRAGEIDYLYSEYGVGDFHRSFAIGELIDTERISAEMRDGVLTLRLPKSERAKPRRIEVKAD